MKNELELFKEIWKRESGKTLRLLESLPTGSYDFRPDPESRSLGEMAWHIPEAEAYSTFAIERGGLPQNEKPSGVERPRAIPELAAGFAHVHADAVRRVAKLTPDDLDRTITYIGGRTSTIRDALWDFVLLHGIHHRAQLGLLVRQFGKAPAELFGPTREAMPLRRR